MFKKDNKDDLSKSGSGRVFGWKNLGLIHSYTIESGYISANYLNTIVDLNIAYPNKK